MSDPSRTSWPRVPLLSGLDKKQRERHGQGLQGADRPRRHGRSSARVTTTGWASSSSPRARPSSRSTAAEVATLGPGSYFGEVALISDRVRTAIGHGGHGHAAAWS